METTVSPRSMQMSKNRGRLWYDYQVILIFSLRVQALILFCYRVQHLERGTTEQFILATTTPTGNLLLAGGTIPRTMALSV